MIPLLMVISPLAGQSLTDEEADRIVAGEMAAIEARKESRPDFTILETHERVEGNAGVVFHKVAPPDLKEVDPVAEVADEVASDEVDFGFYQDERAHRSFSLGIQVYDGEVSELVWRGDRRILRAYSNIDFSYLTPVGEFEGDGVVYSFYAMLTRTTREREWERIQAMREAGIEVPDLMVPEMADFSGTDPEYLIYADAGERIPEELIDALDALHLYYAVHETELKEAALRRNALAEARKRYTDAHPEVVEPTVVHYWKIVSSAGEAGR